MSVVQEHASLKRDHDSFDFDSLVDLEKPFTVPTNLSQTYTSQIEDRDVDSGESSTPAAIVSVRTRKLDPNQSGSTSLTDAGCMSSVKRKSPIPHSELISPLPQQASALPSAFAVLNGSAPPPTKKPKLSFTDTEAEKDAKKIAKGIKDHELAQERAAKQQERQAQAEEKARQNTEKTAERRQKEAEREQKRLALEAKKAARAERKRKKEEEKSMKEEEKRRKEEEKRRKEEEKRRKEEEKLEKQRAQQEKQNKDGKQKPLTSFFLTSTGANLNVLAPGRSESPAPNSCLLTAVANPATSPPKKLEKIAYDNIFSDFYLFQDVTMAPTNRFERDDQASLVLHSTIDSYILGDRSPHRQRGFDAIELFQLSGHANISRGKRCMPIREIMAEMSGKSARPIDLTTDSQNTQIKRANNLLRTVPLKFLKFQEDVRPPYRGTYTRRPVNGMARLARHPLRRDLPDTNYDYDSEAEWVEDEDAENLDSEGDDDEDVAEDGEDMEGFLDDENDDHANSMRLIVQGDLEPISSGLCWEDYRKRSPKVKMMPYRMEFVLDHSMKSIDPFSTRYWEPTSSHTIMNAPRQPLNTLKSNSSTINGSSSINKPIKPLFTTSSELCKTAHSSSSQPFSPHAKSVSSHLMAIQSKSHSAVTSITNVKPRKLVSADDMEDFRREIEGSNLSKVGLIEVLKKKFPGRSGATIKNTLELIAKRVGSREADKRWVIVDTSSAA